MRIDDNGLLRLAAARDSNGTAFLQPHHLLAASRLERLIQRSQLAPRLTMSYGLGGSGPVRQDGNVALDLSDSASDARQRLNLLALALPADCWGVLFDVCGLGKGLQTIETERRWPRRSAKLVLRIGLSQLAAHWGLEAQAQGAERGAARAWRSERLPIIPEGQF
tara:strand:- start:4717 stop:5211 length:495 start_codon:yes stop_codon:yes gene_type:complete